MLLIVRMITRVAPPTEASNESKDSPTKDEGQDVEPDLLSRQDSLRQTLCDYIMSDFPTRCVCRDAVIHGDTHKVRCRIRLATSWMNEEWYNDWIRMQQDPNWVC